jgi:hypothetical protein
MMAAVDDERMLSANEVEEPKGRSDEDHDDHVAADMLSVSDLPAFI